VLTHLDKEGAGLALKYIWIRNEAITAVSVIITAFWIVDTDVSEEPSLHLPDTTVWRPLVAPKPWHILTELQAAVCHKVVPYGSLNDLFSTSGYTAGIHGPISDKMERRHGERVVA
jgi:hypothetical protein